MFTIFTCAPRILSKEKEETGSLIVAKLEHSQETTDLSINRAICLADILAETKKYDALAQMKEALKKLLDPHHLVLSDLESLPTFLLRNALLEALSPLNEKSLEIIKNGLEKIKLDSILNDQPMPSIFTDLIPSLTRYKKAISQINQKSQLPKAKELIPDLLKAGRFDLAIRIAKKTDHNTHYEIISIEITKKCRALKETVLETETRTLLRSIYGALEKNKEGARNVSLALRIAEKLPKKEVPEMEKAAAEIINPTLPSKQMLVQELIRCGSFKKALDVAKNSSSLESEVAKAVLEFLLETETVDRAIDLFFAFIPSVQESKNLIFSSVSQTLAIKNRHIEKALCLTGNISYEIERITALQTIAREIALKGDTQKALSIALNLPYETSKNSSLREIAIATGNKKKAIEIAGAISDLPERIETLEYLGYSSSGGCAIS